MSLSMRLQCLCFLLAELVCDARNSLLPQITLGLSAGEGYGRGVGGLKGLEPILRWTAERDMGDSMLEGGLVVKVEDLDSLPYSVWGRWRQSVGRDWEFSARADSNSNDMSNIGVDLQLIGETTSFQVNGLVNTYSSRAVNVEDVKVSQRIGGVGRGWDSGMWTFVPRYNFQSRRADVRVAYTMDDSMVTLDASRDKQTVTLTRRVNDNDVFINKVSTDREVEIEYRHSLGGYYYGGEGGTLSARYKRDDSLTVQWEDGPWQASVTAPMDGLYTFSDAGVKVNIRRSIDLV